MKKRIAIFASGSGSNAQKLMELYKKSPDVEIALVLTNNPDAYVLQRADNFEIPSHIFDKKEFYQTDSVIDMLKNLEIDLIVLAGFLWLIPKNLIAEYPGRIINIHPALLPKYGGKGMYGDHVHHAVMAAGESEGGITIHYVDENYDEGEYIYQARYKIEKDDNLEMVKFKGQQLEHQHYPRIIDSIVRKIKK
ncbi:MULTISPECIES: phosphoribosylglycinamide formyltransferase [Pedobacter]|uniref:Phosphoribosylglycinamide formyltransferase n=1 Tax=Pedobacter heparinus (strain ATCC 13125 / DSM 2366 / CIP 104194 / JCM 7457 / NBRC 12017 / NCIMB 9290 / NRRL B-14731 / HIM 762-3) TaxID=485917 RepID=C6Y239_PEDHD|nr:MULTISPECIES: phosphoribosylglycinamide formyltransferase [Pedobacter]ACU03032.1 formyl transferase domain protein [Pedobacter heparinus DSM 2366]MBB5438411.1 phosphoribosylglycinamide formyltransferase-1 [Pedobacter sp. AK017]